MTSEKTISVCILCHSGSGHTIQVANFIQDGILSVKNIKCDLLNVEDFNQGIRTLDELSQYEAFIFGSPTYFGDISTSMKQFFDSTVKVWASQAWKDKFATGFTTSSSPSGDKVSTILSLFTFASQQSMNWISCGLFPNKKTVNDEELQINPLGGWSGLITQTASSQTTNSFSGDKIIRECNETSIEFGKRIANFLNTVTVVKATQ